jgi:glutathione S-transferase
VTAPRRVFHLALAADWEAALEVGEYRISTRGARLEEVGFIHASFAPQVAATAARWFADVGDDLVLLEIDPGRLAAPPVIEASGPGGEAFPHLYGPIPVPAVVASHPARMVDGRLVIGAGP